jgi:hypothetical protein
MNQKSDQTPGGVQSGETLHSSVLDLILAAQTEPVPPSLINGILVGRILALDSPASPRVTFPNAPPEGIAARAMLTLTREDIGREVALMFEGGDPSRPIVMGRMAMPAAQENPPRIEAEVDNRRVEIEAQEQLVLRCGESSITLTRAGKIIIRGKYVLSQSAGVNRIQGGSVEIN